MEQPAPVEPVGDWLALCPDLHGNLVPAVQPIERS
jgi:hypothetical protein